MDVVASMVRGPLWLSLNVWGASSWAGLRGARYGVAAMQAIAAGSRNGKDEKEDTLLKLPYMARQMSEIVTLSQVSRVPSSNNGELQLRVCV
jgi:hypothetical protein